MLAQEIKITADGSHTLYVPSLDEHYHSINGAIQEALHVYIDAGLKECNKKEIKVLEYGFGTALNALLTSFEAEKEGLFITYTSLEKYPLDVSVYDSLNYGRIISENYQKIYIQMHRCDWNVPVKITSNFQLLKLDLDFKDYHTSGKYDVIYYDAFAPDKQAGVWSQELFDSLYSMTEDNGIVTTYCAKGYVRRMMKNAGFEVERLPGPPGKREMLRGRKSGF